MVMKLLYLLTSLKQEAVMLEQVGDVLITGVMEKV